jgi:hypothetical protein
VKFLPDIGLGNPWPDRRKDDEANQTEPHTGVQGEGGNGGIEGRQDAGRVGASV